MSEMQVINVDAMQLLTVEFVHRRECDTEAQKQSVATLQLPASSLLRDVRTALHEHLVQNSTESLLTRMFGRSRHIVNVNSLCFFAISPSSAAEDAESCDGPQLVCVPLQCSLQQVASSVGVASESTAPLRVYYCDERGFGDDAEDCCMGCCALCACCACLCCCCECCCNNNNNNNQGNYDPNYNQGYDQNQGFDPNFQQQQYYDQQQQGFY